MNILFVIDEIATLIPGHDTSVAMMEAAQARQAQVFITTAGQLGFAGGPTANCREVTLSPAARRDGKWVVEADWYRLGDAGRRSLGDMDVIFMRTDPPVDSKYLRATYLLDLADPERTLVVNSPNGVRAANEKLFALRMAHLGPPTIVSADRQDILDTVAEWGKAVIKPTDAMAGRGVLILDRSDLNVRSIVDMVTERGEVQVVVQRWIDRSKEGDRRVIVLDGTPIGVVRRVASAGEFRCNMAAGAGVAADAVSDRDRAICNEIGPLLRSYGLYFVGLDVIGDQLTEVNVTSPTGIREIDLLSGSNLAGEVIEWAASKVGERTAPTRPALLTPK